MRLTQPSTPTRYIWQDTQWPALIVDDLALAQALSQARLEQGRLLGQLEAIGLSGATQVSGELWVADALATAAIEGDQLNAQSVRSSVARRLSLPTVGAAGAESNNSDARVEGLVDLMSDAARNPFAELSHDRLWRWQAVLFAATTINGLAGIRRIAVGKYRSHADAMQIVSGPIGREIVHYLAPASSAIIAEMTAFLAWFEASRPDARVTANQQPMLDGIVRAAVAHLWFESIHPFEDGNGRVGRAVADLALAQDAGGLAVFGLSRQFLATRKDYYDALNAAQRGGVDVTPWALWFVNSFTAACLHSQSIVQAAIQKAAFWQRANAADINTRQRKVLARLLELGDGGFLGGLTTEKYSKMTHISKPTASRDLVNLHRLELLVVTGLGKATRYSLKVDGWLG